MTCYCCFPSNQYYEWNFLITACYSCFSSNLSYEWNFLIIPRKSLLSALWFLSKLNPQRFLLSRISKKKLGKKCRPLKILNMCVRHTISVARTYYGSVLKLIFDLILHFPNIPFGPPPPSSGSTGSHPYDARITCLIPSFDFCISSTILLPGILYA